MANYGGTFSNDGRYTINLAVTETLPSDYRTSNKSIVNYVLTATKSSGSGYYDTVAESPIYVNINGVVKENRNISYDFRGSTPKTITIASGSLEVVHNPDGSKTVPVSTSFTDGGNGLGSASCSGSFTLTKIDRYAVTNSVSGSNIEGNFSVNYTKYVSSYSYKLRISLPHIKALETINYNTSGTSFTLSQASIEEIYNTYPTTDTIQLGFAVETWNGNTRLSSGNEKTINCTKTPRVARLRINGEWKNATPYIRIDGQWKKATPYVRVNNEWKRGK